MDEFRSIIVVMLLLILVASTYVINPLAHLPWN